MGKLFSLPMMQEGEGLAEATALRAIPKQGRRALPRWLPIAKEGAQRNFVDPQGPSPWLRGMGFLAMVNEADAYLDYLETGGATVELASTPQQALSLMESGGFYQAAMIDAFLPQQCGVAVAERVAAKQPWCRVFVVAQWLTSPLLRRVQRIPNATVVSRNLSQIDFMFSVVGGTKCTAASLHWLVREISGEARLSRQQERLLWLNLWGYPDQEIAQALGIQLHTVQDYQLALRRKTGVRTKAGYLRLLLEYLGTPAPLESASANGSRGSGAGLQGASPTRAFVRPCSVSGSASRSERSGTRTRT